MLKYDKLKNVNTEEIFFNFKCPHCKIDGMKKPAFEITPIGISYKPDFIDNSDIENETLRKSYNTLPTKRDAIVNAVINNNNSGILVECTHCEQSISIYDKINIPDIKKWVNRHMEKFIDLRIKK